MKQRYMDFVPTAKRQAGQISPARRMVTTTGTAPLKRVAGCVTSTKNEPEGVRPMVASAEMRTKSGVARASASSARTTTPSSRARAVNSVTTRQAKIIKPVGTKVKATTKPVAARVTRPQTATRPADAATGTEVKQKEEKTKKTEEKPKGLKRFSLRRGEKKAEKKPMLGEVEDWSNRFVNTNVPKRPLADANQTKRGVATTQTRRAAVKETNQMRRGAIPAASGPMTRANKMMVAGASGGRNFVYPQKIEKRPLSGTNVYGKKPMVTKPMSKEEPKGPVTIISKPEKQNHVGIIVAIILTIILGAAAGTVAFLILPK
ncbi:hypothetical protein IKE87_01030 [Candidatus Saccharibacteria bacterium]|nr:hypothetical protein [Candidatus Saccharibacteria bacterium]